MYLPIDFYLDGRAKACRSEDTLSGGASPGRSVPQRRRPHSIAGRCPSYAGHTVASQLRRSRGDEMFTSSVYCCSRFSELYWLLTANSYLIVENWLSLFFEVLTFTCLSTDN